MLPEQLPIPVSLLDLALITEGSNAGDTYHKTVEIARKADELGYQRMWLAEHHNMPYVASTATVVLIGHIAGQTRNIRVGSGGIMLPNHSPLVVAEQFGILATLYPGRIDLGLGRAPGTDQVTAQALNKDFFTAAQEFPKNVALIQQYLSADNASGKVRAFPAEGLDIPIWILGSSMDSAVLAARYGLPYAFASHFAPAQFFRAIAHYRAHFQPSPYLSAPKVMACVNMITADTQEEAESLATSFYRMFLNLVRGTRTPLQPPIPNMDGVWSEYEKSAVQQMTAHSFIGDPETIRKNLGDFYRISKVDEIMITMPVYSHEARLKNLEYCRSLFE